MILSLWSGYVNLGCDSCKANMNHLQELEAGLLQKLQHIRSDARMSCACSLGSLSVRRCDRPLGLRPMRTRSANLVRLKSAIRQGTCASRSLSGDAPSDFWAYVESVPCRSRTANRPPCGSCVLDPRLPAPGADPPPPMEVPQPPG
jgi:hypothetical protein